MEDFFQDVKKRRVVPSYDSRMWFNLPVRHNLRLICSRYGGPINQPLLRGCYWPCFKWHFQSNGLFLWITGPPRKLAAVNQFLLTLGRDVTSLHESRTSLNSQTYSHYFDYDDLSQLGLTGMPGIPTSATTSVRIAIRVRVVTILLKPHYMDPTRVCGRASNLYQACHTVDRCTPPYTM